MSYLPHILVSIEQYFAVSGYANSTSESAGGHYAD